MKKRPGRTKLSKQNVPAQTGRDLFARGGRPLLADGRGLRDPVSHRRPSDLGTPELRAKRVALVGGSDIDEAIFREIVLFLEEIRPNARQQLVKSLSPQAKALLNQDIDETLSIHPLGAIFARRLTTRDGGPVVTQEGLWSCVDYAHLHTQVFASRRTGMSAFLRAYLSRVMPSERELTQSQTESLAVAEKKLKQAESALRDAGALSRRLIRDMALFDAWPDFLVAGPRTVAAASYDAQLVAVKRGLDALELALSTWGRERQRRRPAAPR